MHALVTSMLLSVPLLLAGCVTTSGPSPTTPLPQPVQAGAWWQTFQDPGLNDLLLRVLAGNRDLVQASARLDEARALAKIAGAAARPQVTGRAGASRSRLSESTANPLAPGPVDNLLLGLDFAYEADLWGRIRATREAARQQVVLSESEQEALRHSMLATAAAWHFERQGLLREAALVEQQLATYRETEQVQRLRETAGFSSGLDGERIATERASLEVEHADLLLRARQTSHALAELAGLTPIELPEPEADVNAVIPERPATLPMERLNQRPDVRAAQAGWDAATARAASAKSALYPALNLTGSIGYEASRLQNLLDWQARLWAMAGSLTAPLLDGGRLRGHYEAEQARVRVAAARYEQAVLTAHCEVADALAALELHSRQQTAASAGCEAATRARHLSQERYEAGLVSYLEVLESNRAKLTTDRTRVRLDTRCLVATVDLVRALAWPGL